VRKRGGCLRGDVVARIGVPAPTTSSAFRQARCLVIGARVRPYLSILAEVRIWKGLMPSKSGLRKVAVLIYMAPMHPIADLHACVMIFESRSARWYCFSTRMVKRTPGRAWDSWVKVDSMFIGFELRP